MVVTSVTNGFTVSFTLPSYTLRDTTLASYITNEVFKYVKIGDFGNIDDEGYPQLPQFSFDLHVPSNASNFAVASSNQVTQVVNLNRRILPVQEDFGELPASQPTLQLNSSYYASNGSLYGATSQISDPYIVFGEKGVTMSIFPFLYNPQANTLTVVKQVTLTVTYTGGGGIQQLSVNSSNVKRAYLSDFFTNQVSNMQPLNNAPFVGRYLMITAPALEATLTPFANYKSTLGYDVTVVNTSAITNGTTATGIKNYLQAQYNNVNTRPDFVLLVGNTSAIPASAGTSSNINDPVTDLYYACLEGNDLIADVILGRFPIANNTTTGATALQQIITKTMYMESNIHTFTKKAKFIAGQEESKWWDLFNVRKNFMESQFKRGHEYAIKNTFNELGYNSQKLYQPNDAAVRTALNDNPLFFIYSGHGSVSSMSGNSFTLNNTFLNTNCTNTVFPFVFSFACHTGNYENSSCIGTNWLVRANGGVSYFGSSVSTMTNSDVAIEEKIFGDAFTDQDQLGAVINLGMKRYLNRFWSKMNSTRTERYMKAYNLLGDPAFDISRISTPAPAISGSTPICSGSSKTFSVNSNWVSGNYKWDCSANLSLPSAAKNPATATNSTTVSAASSSSSGIGYVYVKNSTGTTLATYNVWVGKPSFSLSHDAYFFVKGPVNIDVVYSNNFTYLSQGVSSNNWSYSGPLTLSNLSAESAHGKGGTTTGTAYVQAKMTNSCGSTTVNTSFDVIQFKSPAYPNPVNDVLSIELDSQSVSNVQNPTFDVRLYDGQGNIVRQQSNKGGTVQFNVSSLPDGIYYLHIYDGVSSAPEIQQIVVQH